jgi:hypothetical protein
MHETPSPVLGAQSSSSQYRQAAWSHAKRHLQALNEMPTLLLWALTPIHTCGIRHVSALQTFSCSLSAVRLEARIPIHTVHTVGG